jgi:ankyrin repeat protein
MESIERTIDMQLQREKLTAEMMQTEMWELKGRAKTIDESLSEMGRQMERATAQQGMDKRMMKLIECTVARTVRETLRESMSEGWVTEESVYRKEAPPKYEPPTAEFSPDFMDCGDSARCLTPPPPLTETITERRFRRYKRVQTPFGTLLVYHSNETTNWDMYPSTDTQPRRIKYEAGFTFLPSPVLFTTAFSFSFTNLFTNPSHSETTLSTSLKIFTVSPSASPIFACARTGNIRGLQELFSPRSASPNDRDEHGRTPLHWAAAMGHEETCRFLLQQGADASYSNDLARTALHWTTLLSCNPNIIRLLISAGCDPALPNVAGQSTLFSRARRGAEMREVIDAMRCQEVFDLDIDQTDNWGRTPLMWEVMGQWGEDVESVRILIERGASVSRRDGMGLTVLHLAMLSCAPDRRKLNTIMELLNAGADPSVEVEELGGLTVADIARYNGVSDMWDLAKLKTGVCDGRRPEDGSAKTSAVAPTVSILGAVMRRRTGLCPLVESPATLSRHTKSLA